MQYITLEFNNNNNNNIKHSRMVLMVLISNGMLLSHFKRNRDAIPLHPTSPQALSVGQNVSRNIYLWEHKSRSTSVDTASHISETEIEETSFDDANWIHLAQDVANSCELVNKLLNS
jgi:hypothetical protein